MPGIINSFLDDYGQQSNFAQVESHRAILKEKLESLYNQTGLKQCLLLTFHYHSPIYDGARYKNGLFINIHNDSTLSDLLNDYMLHFDAFDKEEEHLCGLMITQDKTDSICFEFNAEQQETFSAKLKDVPKFDFLNSLEDCFNQDIFLEKIEFLTGNRNQKANILSKSLLFTGLALGKNVLKDTHIKTVFYPISLKWRNNNDVIAVIVGIFKEEAPPKNTFETTFSSFVYGIHHRELLFDFYKKSPINEDRKRLLNKLSKKVIKELEMYLKNDSEEMKTKIIKILGELKTGYSDLKKEIEGFIKQGKIHEIDRKIEIFNEKCSQISLQIKAAEENRIFFRQIVNDKINELENYLSIKRAEMYSQEKDKEIAIINRLLYEVKNMTSEFLNYSWDRNMTKVEIQNWFSKKYEYVNEQIRN